MESKPYWKKIWYVASMKSKSVLAEDIQQVFNLFHKELLNGICEFNYFSEDSFKKWKETVDSQNLKLEKLILRLSQYLNVDTLSLWGVFCNYLMFEYNGKIEDIASMASYDIHLKTLVQDIWQFYSLERMYMIRSLNYILEKYMRKHSPLHEVYYKFVKKHKISNIRTHLFKQLKHLILEITADSHKNCPDLSQWMNRNLQEQFHVVLSIILTLQIEDASFSEIQEFLTICISYSFTLVPHFEVNVVVEENLQDSVMFAEYASCIMAFDQVRSRDEVRQLEGLMETIDKRHGTLLVLWHVARHNYFLKKHKEDELNHSETFEHAVSKIADAEIFEKLYSLLTCERLMESFAGPSVRRWIHNMFKYICEEYDSGLDILNDNTISLLSKLMEDEGVARQCVVSGESSIIFLAAARMFPFDFNSFSYLIKSAMQHTNLCQHILNFITSLKLYTEDYDCAIMENETRYIDVDYTPLVYEFRGGDLPQVFFPAGTEAWLWHKNGNDLITYSGNYNYFTVLYEYMYYVAYAEDVIQEDISKVMIGLEIMTSILQNPTFTKNALAESKEFSICIFLVTAVFTRAIKLHYHPLIQECLKLFVGFKNFDINQTVEILHLLRFLPIYTHYDLTLQHALKPDSLTSCLLMDFMVEEYQFNSHETLLLYLEFFQYCFKRDMFYKKVLMPGFSFILVHIFPKHLEWEFKNVHKKHQITMACLEVVFEILQRDPKRLQTNEDQLVYKFVIDSFRENNLVLNSYVNLMRVSYREVFSLISNEVDWERGKTLILFRILKYCLSMFLIFLNKYNDEATHKLVSDYCFSLDHSPNMVKIIAGLMMQVFDLSVSKLSCRVLRKIVEKYNVPMMAYLDMDHGQIQATFLQKLRDPVEEDEMKLLILDFISTCVVYGQHGMCAAFFNVNTGKRDKKKVSTGDSVTNFMIEHLKALVQPNCYLTNPLQSSMLDLYHTLWTYHKSILILDLTKKKHFWPMLADPLFKPLVPEDAGYGKILEILTLEIMKDVKNIDPNLLQVLKSIFNPTNVFLDNWYRFVLNTIEEDKNKTIDEGQRLSTKIIWSWKNFLMVCVKHIPDCFKDNKVRCSVSENCLKGLQSHLSQPLDIRLLKGFSSLYLFCIQEWGISSYGKLKERLALLASIYSQFSHYSEVVSTANKEALLAIAPKTLIDIKNSPGKELEGIDVFLSSVVPIVHKEYTIISGVVSKREVCAKKQFEDIHRNWNIIILFGASLLNIRNPEKYGWWFKSSGLIEKVLFFIGIFIEHADTMRSAKIAVTFLVQYAESSLCSDFIYIDMRQFYYNINPPLYYDVSNVTLENCYIDQLESWWYAYRGIFVLNITLMKKLDVLAKPCVFNLFTLQLDVIQHLLQLPQITVEISALKLVKTLLMCFHLSLKWKHSWHTEYHNELEKMVLSLTQTMNHCVLILLRPRMINGFRIEDRKAVLTDDIPESVFVDVIEEVIEVLGLVLQCFIEINPPILDVLDILKPVDESILFIHNRNLFPATAGSSLGSLFHALHFLCKASSQIHSTRKSSTNKSEDPEKSDKTLVIDSNRYFAFVSTETMKLPPMYEKIGNLYIKYKEVTGMSAPWLHLLSADKVNNTLEKLAGFLTQQVFYSVSIAASTLRAEVLKRKLQADLQVFHDYTKKRMQEVLHQYHHHVVKKPGFYKRRFEHDSEGSFRRSLSKSDYEDLSTLHTSVDDEYLHIISQLLQRATKLSGKL